MSEIRFTISWTKSRAAVRTIWQNLVQSGVLRCILTPPLKGKKEKSVSQRSEEGRRRNRVAPRRAVPAGQDCNQIRSIEKHSKYKTALIYDPSLGCERHPEKRRVTWHHAPPRAHTVLAAVVLSQRKSDSSFPFNSIEVPCPRNPPTRLISNPILKRRRL